jgi:hypothetical protein
MQLKFSKSSFVAFEYSCKRTCDNLQFLMKIGFSLILTKDKIISVVEDSKRNRTTLITLMNVVIALEIRRPTLLNYTWRSLLSTESLQQYAIVYIVSVVINPKL